MGTKLSESDKIGLSADEITMLEADNADALLAMSGTDAAPSLESVPVTDEPAEGEGEGDEADLSADQLAAVLDDSAPAPAPAPKPYDVPTTDFDAVRKQLRADRRAVEEKWAGGELTDEQRIEQLDDLDNKIDTLLIESTRAATLREANEQQARNAEAERMAAENAAMQSLATSEAKNLAAGKPGIDYAKDTVAQQQFDMMFAALSKAPENANDTPASLVAKANNAVRALRGLPVGAATAPTPTPAPTKREVPTTLSGLPNAGNAGLKDDVMEQVGRLQGEDLERWLASQTPATVERLMRNADNLALN